MEVRSLASPQLEFSNYSLSINYLCISFQYSMHGRGKELAVLSLSQRTPGRQELRLWSVRTVGDDHWHLAKAELSNYGLTQFVFRMTGTRYRAAIRDIEVQPRSCNQLSG